jgi:phage terminase small subunit
MTALRRRSSIPVHKRASEMLLTGEVQGRLEQLQAEARERHQVSIDSLTDELDADRLAARAAGQYSAAISAVGLKARLHGSSPTTTQRP